MENELWIVKIENVLGEYTSRIYQGNVEELILAGAAAVVYAESVDLGEAVDSGLPWM